MTRISNATEEPDGPGRRERKKAATRQALSDAALRLFLEKGFDRVKVAEIAAAADTALTTLFAHFPGGKEAIVLEDGAEREAALTAAVRGRAGGVSVLEALRAFFMRPGAPSLRTPAPNSCSRCASSWPLRRCVPTPVRCGPAARRPWRG